MEPRDHAALVDQAFTGQASSFNLSAVANADEILDAILDHAQPPLSERWLEAACGPGIVSRRLARPVAGVHGVDVTAAMIETARREASEAGVGNVTFDVADATATSLDSASFDGAITRFSIHHIPVPVRLIYELARVVKPGGKIIVGDHLADDDADARSWSQEIERLRDPSHWACLSAGQMRRTASAPVSPGKTTDASGSSSTSTTGSTEEPPKPMPRRSSTTRSATGRPRTSASQSPATPAGGS